MKATLIIIDDVTYKKVLLKSLSIILNCPPSYLMIKTMIQESGYLYPKKNTEIWIARLVNSIVDVW